MGALTTAFENRSSIEEAHEIVYEKTIGPDLPNHAAKTFEGGCQEAIWNGIRRGTFHQYSEVGRWWYGEHDIDVVRLSPADDRILFAECKSNIAVSTVRCLGWRG